MSHPASPQTFQALSQFVFEKVLNEDPSTHSLTLLGTFPAPTGAKESDGLSTIESVDFRVKAIVRIEKTALDATDPAHIFGSAGLLDRVQLEQSTDIYTWFFGWLSQDRARDVKINVICPATEVHVRKYTKQERIMVHETPELYEKIVKPYIAAFPASRTKWVENILTGLSEQTRILYTSPDFLILPDMKWDLTTLSSLYLVCLVQDRSLRSLRDLRKKHVGLLSAIRSEAGRIVLERWGLKEGSLRMYVHYQPSYYHFHVHIVNANFEGGLMGMTVGQAHLLDDVISLLELEPSEGPGIYERMTITYGLGDQHGLYPAFVQHA